MYDIYNIVFTKSEGGGVPPSFGSFVIALDVEVKVVLVVFREKNNSLTSALHHVMSTSCVVHSTPAASS